ncbi:MAG: nucleotidyltransferase family protein [Dokdonella sp.]
MATTDVWYDTPNAMSGVGAPAHGAILLAAGASRRLGFAKQLIEIDGEPLLRRVAQALLATAPLDCVVVLGHEAEGMRAALDGLALRSVVADEHALGMSASLASGIAALDPRCAGALVALTDQPALDAAHLLALCDVWRLAPSRAVASAYAGVRGVPAILPRAWFGELSKLRGDIGARALLRGSEHEVIAVEAGDLERDLDTPADLR